MLAKENKEQLLFISLKEIVKTINQKNNIKKDLVYEDMKRSIYFILENNRFNYSDAFFILLFLSSDYQIIINKIKENKFKEDRLQDPLFWDGKYKKEKDDFDLYVFFVFRFFFEIYDDLLKDDFKKINNSTINAEKYLKIRDDIIKK